MNPSSAPLRRSQGAAYSLFADTYWKLGHTEQAVAYAQKSLDIISALAAEDDKWRGDLTISLTKMGDALVARGDNQGALERYRDALAIYDLILIGPARRPLR